MATEQDDSDIPESGGVFTFGKSRFNENIPNKFWIRNDEVLQVACGDEHTVLYAESGRVFVFGDNSYGQLGLGNTKPQNKPTCVKSLKGEQVSVIGCGSSHTLVSTSSGLLFAFGQNNYHQCGLDKDGSVETPTEVLLQKPITFTQLCGGSCHSVGLDKNGTVYVWGDNSEGQLGLGDSVQEMELPTRLSLDDKAVHVACGYYHTAVVTADGKLYTFGEEEGGKLGHGNGVIALEPLEVNIQDKVVWVSCGGRHTVAVTARGAVYTFGDGSSGQLGLGTSVMDSYKPSLISYFKDMKIKYTSCGENFTAAVSEKGHMYTFGDGRHGKLALGAENFTNQFRPFKVSRFAKFEVTTIGGLSKRGTKGDPEVSCGGCHTIAFAHRRDVEDEDEEIHDPLNSTFANSLRLSNDGDLGASISARDRRRAKEPMSDTLTRTLPPLTASSRASGLPPLNSTFTTCKLRPLESSSLPNTLDKRKLPVAKFSKDKDEESEEEDSDVSVTPAGSSEDEEDNSPTPQSIKNKREAMKKQSALLANGKGKPVPTKRQPPKPNSRAQREESEEESEVSEEETTPYKHKSRQSNKPLPKSRKNLMDSEEDSETEKRTSKTSKTVAAKNKKNKAKIPESEEDSALEDSEEEEEEVNLKSKNKRNSKANSKIIDKDKRKKTKHESEEEEESENEKKPTKRGKPEEDEDECDDFDTAVKPKSRLNIFGKNKKADIDFDEDDEDGEEDEDEKPSRKAATKTKDNKKAKKVDSEEDEEDDEEEEEKGGGDKSKNKKETKTATGTADEEKPPEEKKSKACTIL